MTSFFLLIFYVSLAVFIYEYYVIFSHRPTKSHHKDNLKIMDQHLPICSS